jgi:CheY-like chemotaxis protein
MASAQGWEILKVLRENSLTQNIPVLFYSLEEEHDSGSLLDLDYLTKPMNMAELAQALERQGLSVGAGREGKTLLIVDDEPGVLEMHARIVETWSPECRVWKARNGREALEVIRQHRPNLILLDLMMPELDGFGVLEMMQSDELNRTSGHCVDRAKSNTRRYGTPESRSDKRAEKGYSALRKHWRMSKRRWRGIRIWETRRSVWCGRPWPMFTSITPSQSRSRMWPVTSA